MKNQNGKMKSHAGPAMNGLQEGDKLWTVKTIWNLKTLSQQDLI